jgi:hypothetical protein
VLVQTDRAQSVVRRNKGRLGRLCQVEPLGRSMETTKLLAGAASSSTFKLQGPSGCGAVDIFTWGHPTPLTNGDHVRVDGVFETEHHQGHYTFYNEVQATKVMPVPQ